MQTTVPLCLHTLGLFLERGSTRFTDCPKRSYNFVYRTWEQGRDTKLTPTHVAVLWHVSHWLRWHWIGFTLIATLSMFQKAFSNEHGITNFVDSKSFCSHPKSLGIKLTWDRLKKEMKVHKFEQSRGTSTENISFEKYSDFKVFLSSETKK